MSENALPTDAAPAPAKADPETLVLRGRPRPVVRFRRGLIIGVTAAFSAAIVGLSWFALEPPSFRAASEDVRSDEPLRAQTPDALAGAPRTYGDVPRLGPPLPGDLGRPILERQREMAAASPPVEARSAMEMEAERARSAAVEQRQRALAELEAARSSAVLVSLAGRGASRGASPVLGQDGSNISASASSEAGRKAAFAGRDQAGASEHKLQDAPSPWTLSAGTIIPASLITGINSDLPGIVIAQVTEPVRDTATGRTVLIPQGARLIGSYDNRVAFGQRRALLVWQRIVFPDASSITLDKLPASDSAGFAGLEDRVNFHTGRLLKGIALSTLLGVGTELGVGGGSELAEALRESAQQGAARAGDQITQRNLEVQPTITVRPGWPLRAIVHQDLILQPWKG